MENWQKLPYSKLKKINLNNNTMHIFKRLKVIS